MSWTWSAPDWHRTPKEIKRVVLNRNVMEYHFSPSTICCQAFRDVSYLGHRHPWIFPFAGDRHGWDCQDAVHKWYEVVMVDPFHSSLALVRSRQNFGPREPNETNTSVESVESEVDFRDVFFSCWSLVLSCPILVRHFSVNHPRRLPRVIRNDPRINWTAIGRIMMAYFRQAEIGWFNHKILGFNARKFFCGLTWFNRQTSAFELGFNHQNLIFARTIGIRNQEWGIENWMVGRHDQNLWAFASWISIHTQMCAQSKEFERKCT